MSRDMNECSNRRSHTGPTASVLTFWVLVLSVIAGSAYYSNLSRPGKATYTLLKRTADGKGLVLSTQPLSEGWYHRIQNRKWYADGKHKWNSYRYGIILQSPGETVEQGMELWTKDHASLFPADFFSVRDAAFDSDHLLVVYWDRIHVGADIVKLNADRTKAEPVAVGPNNIICDYLAEAAIKGSFASHNVHVILGTIPDDREIWLQQDTVGMRWNTRTPDRWRLLNENAGMTHEPSKTKQR